MRNLRVSIFLQLTYRITLKIGKTEQRIKIGVIIPKPTSIAMNGHSDPSSQELLQQYIIVKHQTTKDDKYNINNDNIL